MIRGIGTDIVDHERINIKMAKRLLTTNEFEEFEKRSDKVQFIASRFAGKEAIVKATNRKYLLQEIELLNDKYGALNCNIEGIQISVSHEKKYSVAFAIWETNE